MSILSSQVGIDVASEWLDVSIDGSKPFRIANKAGAAKTLVKRLPPGSVIYLESSGGYERLPRTQLRAAGFEVRTLDPFKVRRQAQANGTRGKTDALDAVHLSRCGASLKAQPEKSEAREALCDLSRTIEELKKAAAQMKVRAAKPGIVASAKQALLQAAKSIGLQVSKLENEFAKSARATSLSQRYELSSSVEGVGPVLSRVATCELPDVIEEFTDAQISSYVGVAPIDDSSGKTKKPARVGRGNSRLKAALYLPALCCVHRYKWAKDLYARLRARGRAHQQAIVAVMRRLLLRILDVLRRGTPWVKRPTAA